MHSQGAIAEVRLAPNMGDAKTGHDRKLDLRQVVWRAVQRAVDAFPEECELVLNLGVTPQAAVGDENLVAICQILTLLARQRVAHGRCRLEVRLRTDEWARVELTIAGTSLRGQRVSGASVAEEMDLWVRLAGYEQVVDSLGGAMTAEIDLGAGCRFTVLIPSVEARRRPPRAWRSPPKAHSTTEEERAPSESLFNWLGTSLRRRETTLPSDT